MELKLNSKEEIEKYLNEPIPEIDIKEKVKEIRLELKIDEKEEKLIDLIFYRELRLIKKMVKDIENLSDKIKSKENKERIIKAIEILEGRE